MEVKVLRSKLDQSVNFVLPTSDGGAFEARYVRREPEYFCCYLSSHSGCNKGCKFCHLTATKQTMYTPATVEEMKMQAERVFDHFSDKEEVDYDYSTDRVHFNFMARGEPLDNADVNSRLLEILYETASEHSIIPRFNISTIMPKSLSPDTDITLAERFTPFYPVIYYSLYSLDKEWRKKWLPGAMEPEQALDILRDYQTASGTIVVIHGAFIEGENDNAWGVGQMMKLVQQKGVIAKFNIVRYNPFSPEYGEESNFLPDIRNQINGYMPVKIVSRVGMDVAASCGTFIV